MRHGMKSLAGKRSLSEDGPRDPEVQQLMPKIPVEAFP
jgi:hypothetical protein